MDNHFNSINHCVTIKYNVSYHFKSYKECSFCNNIFCSLRETGGLKIDFKIGISILYFYQCPQQVSFNPLHCDFKCFGCNRWKSQTMYISNLEVIHLTTKLTRKRVNDKIMIIIIKKFMKSCAQWYLHLNSHNHDKQCWNLQRFHLSTHVKYL